MSTALATITTGGGLDRYTADSWQEWAGKWLAAQRSIHTKQAYGRDLDRFSVWLADHGYSDPRQVTRALVDLFRTDCEAEGLKPATVARRLAALSSFYDYLLSEEQIRANPTARVARPKQSEGSPRQWLTQDQARTCLDTAVTLGPVHQALVALCFLAGLRVSEALGLHIENLGEAQGHKVARVSRKGGRSEDVVLSPICLDLLAPVIGVRKAGPVIVGADGLPIDRHKAGRLISEVGRRAGLTQQLVPHDLRHSCAVLSLKAGAPLHRVQQQLGHADPRTTQRYTHHLDALDNAAAYNLADFLQAGE